MKYDCFVSDPEQLRDGMEKELVIRDLSSGVRKYDSRYVLAMLIEPGKDAQKADVLYVRQLNGELHKKEWLIKVVEELGVYKTVGG